MSRALRLALAGAVCLAAAAAAAFVRSSGDKGVCLWWRSRTVPYLLSDFDPGPPAPATRVCSAGASDLARVEPEVVASFQAWSRATRAGETTPCTDLQFVYSGRTASVAAGNDGANLVVWRAGQCSDLVAPSDPCFAAQTCANVHNCWEGSTPSVIALTTTSYRVSTGEIIDADLELNGWDGTSATAPPGFYFTCEPEGTQVCLAPGQTVPACAYTDVRNTVTHEAGHVLGLAHTTVAGATMEATALRAETSKRTLAPDDVEGVCTIYPAGRATSTCVDSSSGGCGCGSGGGGGLLGLLALALLRGRGRRRQ